MILIELHFLFHLQPEKAFTASMLTFSARNVHQTPVDFNCLLKCIFFCSRCKMCFSSGICCKTHTSNNDSRQHRALRIKSEDESIKISNIDVICFSGFFNFSLLFSRAHLAAGSRRPAGGASSIKSNFAYTKLFNEFCNPMSNKKHTKNIFFLCLFMNLNFFFIDL